MIASAKFVLAAIALPISVYLLFRRKEEKLKIPPLTLRRRIKDSIPKNADLGSHFVKMIQERGSITWTSFLFMKVLMVSGKDWAQFISEHERLGNIVNLWPESTRRLVGDASLAVLSGAAHTKMRKLISTVFRPQQMKTYLPKMQSLFTAYIRDHVQGKEANVENLVRLCVLRSAFECLFSVSLDNDEAIKEMEDWASIFRVWLGGLFSLPINFPGFAFHNALIAREELLNKLIGLIRKQVQRYEESGRDEKFRTVFTEMALNSEVKLSDRDLSDQALTLFFAGHDTNTSSISNLIDFLYQNPEVMQKAREEQFQLFTKDRDITTEDLQNMPYLEACFKESTRLRPPVGAVFKTTTADIPTEYGTIEKGTTLMYSLIGSNINYNSDIVTADKYYPERYLTEDKERPFVGFGIGTHTCVGKTFAVQQIKIFMSLLLRSCDWTMVSVKGMHQFPSPFPDTLVMKFTVIEGYAQKLEE